MHRFSCSTALACALFLLLATTGWASPSSRPLLSGSTSYPDSSLEPGEESSSSTPLKESKGHPGAPTYLGTASVVYAYSKSNLKAIKDGKGMLLPVYELSKGTAKAVAYITLAYQNPMIGKAYWSAYQSNDWSYPVSSGAQLKYFINSNICQFSAASNKSPIAINHAGTEGSAPYTSSKKEYVEPIDKGIWELRRRKSQSSPDSSIATFLVPSPSQVDVSKLSGPPGSSDVSNLSMEYIKGMIAKGIVEKSSSMYGSGYELRIVVFSPSVQEVTPSLVVGKLMLPLANDLMLSKSSQA